MNIVLLEFGSKAAKHLRFTSRANWLGLQCLELSRGIGAATIYGLEIKPEIAAKALLLLKGIPGQPEVT